MNSLIRSRTQAGVTLIELIVVVTIAGVLLAISVPAFSAFIASKRVEGVANELATDLQYARSEAVSRRCEARVSFTDATSYLIRLEDPPLLPNGCPEAFRGQVLKTVNLSGNVSFVSAPASIAFERVRGLVSDSGAVTVGSSIADGRVQVSVSAVGRTQMCAPSGHSMPGFKTC